MTIKIQGEVVHRIFNEKKEAKSGLMYSDDYLVLKTNERLTKTKTQIYDFFPIKIYSSNTVHNWLGDVQNGDIVECEIEIECWKPAEYVVEERKSEYNGVTERRPNLWPQLKLSVFSDEAIVVIKSNSKEDILDHNSNVDLKPPIDDDNDLPFAWFIPIIGMAFLEGITSVV